MSLRSVLYDPEALRIALFSIGLALFLAAYLLHRHRSKGEKKAKGPLLLLRLDKTGPLSQDVPPPSTTSTDNSVSAAPPAAPAFKTLQGRLWAAADLLRALLVLLSLVVAAGFVLVLLPQPAVDRMAEDLRSRKGGASRQEMIAFLYVGDETKNNQFQVRGLVRNITTDPIEQLDAAIRFLSHDGSVLETAIVRMSK